MFIQTIECYNYLNLGSSLSLHQTLVTQVITFIRLNKQMEVDKNSLDWNVNELENELYRIDKVWIKPTNVKQRK